MKSWFSHYWKIALSLCVIFASGSGIGYLWGQRQAAGNPIVVTEPSAVAQEWKASALSKLQKELELSTQQAQEITNVLVTTENSISQTRERTLLQMHLQVLKAHDGFAPFLNPTQLAKLQRMREELKQRILKRFSNLLTEPEKSSLLSLNTFP